MATERELSNKLSSGEITQIKVGGTSTGDILATGTVVDGKIVPVSNRVGVLEGLNSYDYVNVANITITDDTYEEIAKLLTTDREAGIYKITQSMIYSLDSAAHSSYFRFSNDGGVTWIEIRREPKDNTDKIPVNYSRTINHAGGVIDIRIEARKEVAGDVMEIYTMEIAADRKA